MNIKLEIPYITCLACL